MTGQTDLCEAVFHEVTRELYRIYSSCHCVNFQEPVHKRKMKKRLPDALAMNSKILTKILHIVDKCDRIQPPATAQAILSGEDSEFLCDEEHLLLGRETLLLRQIEQDIAALLIDDVVADLLHADKAWKVFQGCLHVITAKFGQEATKLATEWKAVPTHSLHASLHPCLSHNHQRMDLALGQREGDGLSLSDVSFVSGSSTSNTVVKGSFTSDTGRCLSDETEGSGECIVDHHVQATVLPSVSGMVALKSNALEGNPQDVAVCMDDSQSVDSAGEVASDASTSASQKLHGSEARFPFSFPACVSEDNRMEVPLEQVAITRAPNAYVSQENASLMRSLPAQSEAFLNDSPHLDFHGLDDAPDLSKEIAKPSRVPGIKTGIALDSSASGGSDAHDAIICTGSCCPEAGGRRMVEVVDAGDVMLDWVAPDEVLALEHLYFDEQQAAESSRKQQDKASANPLHVRFSGLPNVFTNASACLPSESMPRCLIID